MLYSSLLLLVGVITASASALAGVTDDFGLTHNGRRLEERGAKQPTISFKPRFPQQCGHVEVSWTGKGPFELQLGNWRGPVETHSGFLAWEFHEGLTQTSWTYQVPFPPGATFMAQIKTADGWTILRRATVLRGNKNCQVIETWSEGPPWPSITPDTRTSAPTYSPTGSSGIIPTPSTELLSSPTICWVRPSDIPSDASSFQLSPTVCGSSSPPPASAGSSSFAPSPTTVGPPLPTSGNVVLEFKGDPTRCSPQHIVFSPQLSDTPYTLLLILQEGIRTINNADPNGGLGYVWNVDTRSRFLAAYIYDTAGNYGVHAPVYISGNETSCIQ